MVRPRGRFQNLLHWPDTGQKPGSEHPFREKRVAPISTTCSFAKALEQCHGRPPAPAAGNLYPAPRTNPQPWAAIRTAILREVGEAYVLLGGGRLPASQADPGQGGHEAPSEEEQGRQYRQAIHRIFRSLELLYTLQDIRNTYRGLSLRRSNEVRASSIEFLDNLLLSGLKKWILPLVDDSMPVEEKLKVGNSFVQ